MKSSFLNNTIFTFLCCISFIGVATAQQIVGLNAVWSDDITDWRIFVDDFEGTLDVVWQGNLTEWRYTIDDETSGTIRLKWKDDPSNWEIRGNDGSLITARTIWPNSLREWRLTDNSKSIELKPRWGNNNHEWLMQSRSYGEFYIYQNWEGDPREWTVEDETEDLSPHMKMALLFLSMFQTVTSGR